MSRLIRVSDDLHARIEAMANRSYRSLAGQIEFMVDAIGSDTPKEITQLENNVPYQRITVTPLNKKGTPDENTPVLKIAKPRTPQYIIGEIREFESMIEAEKEFNQDPESRDRNITEWQGEINGLWTEYHELRGTN